VRLTMSQVLEIVARDKTLHGSMLRLDALGCRDYDKIYAAFCELKLGVTISDFADWIMHRQSQHDTARARIEAARDMALALLDITDGYESRRERREREDYEQRVAIRSEHQDTEAEPEDDAAGWYEQAQKMMKKC
jgi:hypothetical protein